METKKYRVEYNQFSIMSIMEDGEFYTASANSIICDTIENIKKMLSILNIDTSELNKF